MKSLDRITRYDVTDDMCGGYYLTPAIDGDWVMVNDLLEKYMLIEKTTLVDHFIKE